MFYTTLITVIKFYRQIQTENIFIFLKIIYIVLISNSSPPMTSLEQKIIILLAVIIFAVILLKTII